MGTDDGDSVKVCVIGLGKLGLPLAALAAASGHDVRGYDANPAQIAALRESQVPIDEPGLEELLGLARPRLTFVDSVREGVQGWADVSCVIVPTPSLADGYFDNSHVIAAVAAIGEAVSDGHRHVVNVVSTVMPGSCGGAIRDALEAASGRAVGDSLGLCYNPEFIALGTVIADMKSPDMHLIGQSEEWSGDVVAHLLKTMTTMPVPQQRLGLWEAELVKLAVNNYVTMKVSFANLIAMLVDHGPKGADVDRVTSAIGMDGRIGTRYLKGGAPYGGPCFPRDTRALKALASASGLTSSLSAATEEANSLLVDYLATVCMAESPTGNPPTVCLVGATYKAESGVLDDSPSLALAARLAGNGAETIIWDHRRGLLAEDGYRAADDPPPADVYVLMVPDASIKESVSGFRRGARVVDIWRQLPDSPAVPGVIAFGRGRSE